MTSRRLDTNFIFVYDAQFSQICIVILVGGLVPRCPLLSTAIVVLFLGSLYYIIYVEDP